MNVFVKCLQTFRQGTKCLQMLFLQWNPLTSMELLISPRERGPIISWLSN